MGKEKFVINKVIDKNMIKDRVTEKHEMTFEKLEEVMVQDLGSISDLIGIQTENDINIYQFYEIWFSSLLTSTTLDELEFINANNLFGLDRNNLLDYKCQLMIDERIANFRNTLEDLRPVPHADLSNQRRVFYFHTLHQEGSKSQKIHLNLLYVKDHL